MYDPYKFSIQVGAIAWRILKNDDHSAINVKFTHDFAMLAGKPRIKDLDVIVWDSSHCEDLVQDLNTLYFASNAVEFRPDLSRDSLFFILNLLWVNFSKFQLRRISQFLI